MCLLSDGLKHKFNKKIILICLEKKNLNLNTINYQTQSSVFVKLDCVYYICNSGFRRKLKKIEDLND